MPRSLLLASISSALAVACGSPVTEPGTGGSTTGGTSVGTTGEGGLATGSTTSAASTSSGSSSGGTTAAGSGTSASGSTGSGSTSGSASTTGGRDAGFVMAAHAAFPAIPDNGGPTVPLLEVVSVTFPGTLFDIGAYVDVLLASAWFPVVGADYGIAPGQLLASYTFPDAGPATEDQTGTEAFLGSLIDAGLVPNSTANTVYAVQYPPGTAITSQGAKGCSAFGGYHSSFTLWDGSIVYYAVIPDCSDTQAANSFGVASGKLLAEAATSHELLEAASDPDPFGAPAYAWSPNNQAFSSYLAYTVQGWNELGDACEGPGLVELDGGFVAQRLWSNTAALAATGSPCVPVPAGEVYYNVSTASTLLTATANQPTAQTFQVTLDGWSNAPTGGWDLSATTAHSTFDTNPSLAGASGGYAAMDNGRSVLLTLTVPANTKSGSYSSILLASVRQADYPRYNILPLMVYVQ